MYIALDICRLYRRGWVGGDFDCIRKDKTIRFLCRIYSPKPTNSKLYRQWVEYSFWEMFRICCI